MNWINLSRYGFVKPYNFPVAIVVILSLIFLLLVVISFILTLLVKDTGIIFEANSPRFIYFSYLLILSLAVLIFVPYIKFASLLLLLAGAEYFLGFGTLALNKVGFRLNTLFPENTLEVDAGFVYHPLLVGIPRANYIQPGVFDVEHNGFSQRSVRTSVAPDENAVNLAVFGGSSTYDFNENPYTWVERLSNRLGPRFYIVNNGVPGYGTAEHLVQTAFYVERGLPKLPDCAIYYMGWNDIRNVGLQKVDSGFADFHLLSQFQNLRVRSMDYGLLNASPLFVVLSRSISALISPIPYPKSYKSIDSVIVDENMIKNNIAIKYSIKNIQNIIALNYARGIKTILLPQMLNPEKLTGETSYGWLPRIADKDVMTVLRYFNGQMKFLAASSSATYIPIDQEKFTDDDFVDNGHFSVSGSDKFSKIIASSIKTLCSVD